jgi:hypothetical protein
MTVSNLLDALYKNTLSDKIKERSERVILLIAITCFIIHLAIIYLVDFKIIFLSESSELLGNPIAAIYTPFSFILLYEVYLLIYYLPKSFTTYISKQYEIITLIIIRRLFKDLSNLTLSSDWFTIKYDLQFTYDLVTSILMFFLIYLFYLQSKIKYNTIAVDSKGLIAISKFIKIKKVISALLVPVFILLAFTSFTDWLINITYTNENTVSSFANINNIFFEQFFTVLIFADVLLLLFSFFITDEFHKVIRNSGFIISTILIRISFSTSGLINNLLILCAIIFGLLIIIIHNKFEKSVIIEKKVDEAIEY